MGDIGIFMNLKEYLIELKHKTSTLLLGYCVFLITKIIKCYIYNTSFNYNLIPPYIFNNTATYGILFVFLISPFIYNKLKK